MEKILLPEIKDLHLIDVYVANSGYNAAKKAFTQTPDEIIDQVAPLSVLLNIPFPVTIPSPP